MRPGSFVDIYEIVLPPEADNVNFEEFMAEELNPGHGNYLYRRDDRYILVVEWVGRPHPFIDVSRLEEALKSFSARVSGDRFRVSRSRSPDPDL
jgi:hypothetical protein